MIGPEKNKTKNKMKAMQSPSTLCENPSTTEFQLPAYDWNKQTRHDTIVAGSFSGNSMQTFDYSGKPTDSKSDNND